MTDGLQPEHLSELRRLTGLASAGRAPLPETATTGRLLKIREVVSQTALHRATIYRRIAEGTFPRPRRLGRQAVAWSESEIEAWKAARPT